MKKKSGKAAVLFVFIMMVAEIFAQTKTFSYVYDASGNRIERLIRLRSAEVKDTATVEQPTYTDALGELNIHIYPNPTHGLLNVQISNMPENQSAQIQVMDITGRLLYNKTADGTTSVDLSSQPTGTYVLRFVFNGKTSTWKILKQ